jgi:Raf kinase inhibitor-like YbhB/YbcL family protein
MRTPAARTLAVLVAVLVVLGACSKDDGRTLQEPQPGATAPPRTTATTAASISPGSPTTAFSLTSDVLGDGEPIPTKYSCDGENVSPPLRWAGVPAQAAALALVVDDPDAGGFVHWVVWNIPSDTSEVAEASTPPGVEGRNGTGDVGWTGPCPPRGEIHRYQFTLYALGDSIDLADGTDGKDARSTIEGAAVAQARLSGTFIRQ